MMNDTLITTPRAYSIVAARLDYLRTKVEELNRKATKLGVEPVGMQVVSLWEKEITGEDGKFSHYLKFVEVVVYGGSPRLPGGWTFWATIQHTTEGNIIRNSPAVPKDFTFPASYRTCTPECDHCRTVRNRIDTYVLRDDSGNFKHVGKNCLEAYLGGASVDNIAARMSWLSALSGALDFAEDDGGEGGFGGGSVTLFQLSDLVAWVSGVIRVEGGSFVSGAAAKRAEETGGGNVASTKELVLSAMFPPRGASKKFYEWVREVRPTDEEREAAKGIVERARAILATKTEDNDFTHNLRVVTGLEFLTQREVGLGCYVWEFVRREEAIKIEREAASKASAASTHVGTLGERLRGLKLTVRRVVGLPDYGFGPSSINIFADESGNLFVWKTGTTDLEPGDSVVLDGTVKEHNDYKGALQTVLTRCKIKG